MVHEVPHALVFEEGNPPAIAVVVCAPPALRESAEAERDVRRYVAVHAEKLAHRTITRLSSRWTPLVGVDVNPMSVARASARRVEGRTLGGDHHV
jgi:hypothetical protein